MFISITFYNKANMKKGMHKEIRRVIITISSIALVAIIIYLVIILQSQNIRNESFMNSYESLVSKARILTQSYQNEVGKWQAKQLDNKTMISITNDYLPRYKALVNESKKLNPPTKQYQNQLSYIQRALSSN